MPPIEDSRHNGWLSPLIYLSNNWLSMAGVLLVTSATVFWLFLLPTTSAGEASSPYIGILAFLLIPALFFAGLILMPIGVWLRRRGQGRAGIYPSQFPPLTWQNRELRRLVTFIIAATFVNIVVASQVTYSAVSYMDSASFCGRTCHVMLPEFTGHESSAHSHVECVKCHIGPGATSFAQSKISGVRRVFAVIGKYYPRPIPSPVEHMRPARETCEVCHWRQKHADDRLHVISSYADDEANNQSKTVLLMKIGGGRAGVGIHGTHLGSGVKIRYACSDVSRQTIPWVEYEGPGRKTLYVAADAKTDSNLPTREMGCIDCHNRPSHSYQTPERAVDRALLSGELSAALPFAKKNAVAVLKAGYTSRADASQRIPAAFEALYRDRSDAVKTAAQHVLDLYNRNVFPEMNIQWGTYPNHLGHTDFPGCFRCHDGSHAERGGTRSIPQDCNACHMLLAMDEANPKVLSDLGIAEGAAK